VIDQVGGRLGHAPGATARAEATLFTRKSDELFMTTVGATQT
jgi:hypothetical protein